MHSTIAIIRLGRLLTGVSYFLLMPVLPVLLMRAPFHFTAAQTSWSIAVLGFAGGGFTVFCAPIVRRVGDKWSICLGYGGTALSMAALAYWHEYAVVLGLLFINGITMSIAMLGARMMVSTMSDADRLTGFSQMFAWFNGGCVLGQAVVLLLPFREQFYVPIVLAAGVQLLAGVVQLKLPRLYHGEPAQFDSLRDIVRTMRAEWPSLKLASFFLLLAMASYYLLMQQSELIVAYIEHEFLATPQLGFALALNPILIVTLQGRFTRWFQHLEAQSFGKSFIVSFAWYALAYACVGLWWSPWIMWVAVLLIACGEMLITPHIDYYLSRLCPKHILPYVLGMTPMAFALGRALCGFWGIRYLGAATEHAWPLQWWWYGQVGFSLLFAMIVWIGAKRICVKL